MATIPEALAIAVQHHQAGNLQAAEQIYRQILAVEPQHADALHLLGVVALQVGKPEVAVEHITRAITLRGNDVNFHNNLGQAYQALGRMPEAVACYRRVLELQPDNAVTFNNLGTVLRIQGKLNEAIACPAPGAGVETELCRSASQSRDRLQGSWELGKRGRLLPPHS